MNLYAPQRVKQKSVQVGSKNGYLTVLSVFPASRNGGRKTHSVVLVRCICGREKTVRRSNFSKTFSCGCYRTEANRDRSLKHGMSRTPTYQAWRRLCRRDWRAPKLPVHKPWVRSFAVFLDEFGVKPSPEHKLVRLNPKLGHVPGNVAWSK